MKRAPEEVAPDLTEFGGRWDAAIHIVAESARWAAHPELLPSELELIQQAVWREDLTKEDVDELRTLAASLLPGGER